MGKIVSTNKNPMDLLSVQKSALTDILKHRPLTPKERSELVSIENKIKRLWDEAEPRVKSVIPMIHKICGKYYKILRGYGSIDYQEVFQAGKLGAYRASFTYDPDKAKFTTYSTLWIVQSIQREYDHIFSPYESKHPRDKETGERKSLISIDAIGFYTDDEMKQSVMIPTVNDRTADYIADIDMLRRCLKCLPKREAELLVLMAYNVKTKILMDRFKVSKERIRQMMTLAVSKLRKMFPEYVESNSREILQYTMSKQSMERVINRQKGSPLTKRSTANKMNKHKKCLTGQAS